MDLWRARLAEGDVEAAWTLFIDRYRPLIVATIRHLVEVDDVPDALAHVCLQLATDDLARLRRYRWDSATRARFSTWLVTVVQNLAIDRLRKKAGRRRVRIPSGLSELQQRIFTCVFVEHRCHTETYEVVRRNAEGEMSFAWFLKELAVTYRVIERVRPRGVMHYLTVPFVPAPIELSADEPLAAAEVAGRIASVLRDLSTEDQLALQLFIVEGLAATDVARTLGWPNAKAVYNRVYRALHRLRTILERDGIGPADL